MLGTHCSSGPQSEPDLSGALGTKAPRKHVPRCGTSGDSRTSHPDTAAVKPEFLTRLLSRPRAVTYQACVTSRTWENARVTPTAALSAAAIARNPALRSQRRCRRGRAGRRGRRRPLSRREPLPSCQATGPRGPPHGPETGPAGATAAPAADPGRGPESGCLGEAVVSGGGGQGGQEGVCVGCLGQPRATTWATERLPFVSTILCRHVASPPLHKARAPIPTLRTVTLSLRESVTGPGSLG